MKKFLSLVLALVMTMSLVTVSAGAKDFTDSTKIQYTEAVDVMSAVKVIDGYAEGDFRPSTTLTRGAAAKIICNLILGPTTASALVADAAPYKDVPTNHTFAGYIAYCQKTGIISGYADGTFKPANTLTGYAFMKMLLGALGYKADVEGYWGGRFRRSRFRCSCCTRFYNSHNFPALPPLMPRRRRWPSGPCRSSRCHC